jgi:hypothetical protein
VSSDAHDRHDRHAASQREPDEAAPLAEVDAVALAERFAGVEVATREYQHRCVACERAAAVLGARGDGARGVEPRARRGQAEGHVVHQAVGETPMPVAAPERCHVTEHVGRARHAVVVRDEQHPTLWDLLLELGLAAEVAVVERVHEGAHALDEALVAGVEIVGAGAPPAKRANTFAASASSRALGVGARLHAKQARRRFGRLGAVVVAGAPAEEPAPRHGLARSRRSPLGVSAHGARREESPGSNSGSRARRLDEGGRSR